MSLVTKMKNQFTFISFRKIQFLPSCIWYLPFMSYRLRPKQKMRECFFQSSGRIFREMMGGWLFTSGSAGGSRRDTLPSAGIRRSVSWRRMWNWNSWGRAATPPSSKECPHCNLHSPFREMIEPFWIFENLPVTFSVADPRHFGVDPDPRIHAS